MTTNIRHSVTVPTAEQYIYSSPPSVVMLAIRRIVGTERLGADMMCKFIKQAIDSPGTAPTVTAHEMVALTDWWQQFHPDWHMASLRYEFYHGRPPIVEDNMYTPQQPPIE